MPVESMEIKSGGDAPLPGHSLRIGDFRLLGRHVRPKERSNRGQYYNEPHRDRPSSVHELCDLLHLESTERGRHGGSLSYGLYSR